MVMLRHLTSNYCLRVAFGSAKAAQSEPVATPGSMTDPRRAHIVPAWMQDVAEDSRNPVPMPNPSTSPNKVTCPAKKRKPVEQLTSPNHKGKGKMDSRGGRPTGRRELRSQGQDAALEPIAQILPDRPAPGHTLGYTESLTPPWS
jgi:hypothetical protein